MIIGVSGGEDIAFLFQTGNFSQFFDLVDDGLSHCLVFGGLYKRLNGSFSGLQGVNGGLTHIAFLAVGEQLVGGPRFFDVTFLGETGNASKAFNLSGDGFGLGHIALLGFGGLQAGCVGDQLFLSITQGIISGPCFLYGFQMGFADGQFFHLRQGIDLFDHGLSGYLIFFGGQLGVGLDGVHDGFGIAYSGIDAGFVFGGIDGSFAIADGFDQLGLLGVAVVGSFFIDVKAILGVGLILI